MKLLPKNIFIQNLDATLLRENFLISSISTIFVIRFFLRVTNYPELSGAGLHIAHLLWGGFFMLVALLLLFSFLSRGAMGAAAFLGGVGFGAFIDELGKFITSDNNYFFQPTFALIYVIFICLYIVFRLLERQTASKDEYLVNAIEMVKDAVIDDLDQEEKQKALSYLARSEGKDPLVIALKKFLSTVESVPPPPPSLLTRFRSRLRVAYMRLAESKIFVRSLAGFLLFQAVLVILFTLIGPRHLGDLSFSEIGRVLSSSLALFFVVLALSAFATRSRLLAYRFLKASTLTLLLVTQFFQFYDDPLAAVLGVLINGLFLLVIDYIIDQESKVSS